MFISCHLCTNAVLLIAKLGVSQESATSASAEILEDSFDSQVREEPSMTTDNRPKPQSPSKTPGMFLNTQAIYVIFNFN